MPKPTSVRIMKRTIIIIATTMLRWTIVRYVWWIGGGRGVVVARGREVVVWGCRVSGSVFEMVVLV